MFLLNEMYLKFNNIVSFHLSIGTFGIPDMLSKALTFIFDIPLECAQEHKLILESALKLKKTF